MILNLLPNKGKLFPLESEIEKWGNQKEWDKGMEKVNKQGTMEEGARLKD